MAQHVDRRHLALQAIAHQRRHMQRQQRGPAAAQEVGIGAQAGTRQQFLPDRRQGTFAGAEHVSAACVRTGRAGPVQCPFIGIQKLRQRRAVDLSGQAQRQPWQGPKKLWQRRWRQQPGQVLGDRFGVGEWPRRAAKERHQVLRCRLVAAQDHGRLRDAGAAGQRQLNLVDLDPVSLQLDLPVDAAEKFEPTGFALRTLAHQVAGAVPAHAVAQHELSRREVRVVQIAQRDASPAGPQFTFVSRTHAVRGIGGGSDLDPHLGQRHRAAERNAGGRVGVGQRHGVAQREGGVLGGSVAVDEVRRRMGCKHAPDVLR